MAASARLRLTLLYSGMFLALGTAIVVVIYLVGSHGILIRSGSSSVAAVPSPAQGSPILHAVVSQQHSADIDQLLGASWLTLALTAVASALLGWFVAGRVLRPLRQMTAAARTISAGNLHHRLALTGPPDEFKQLGDTFDDLLARLEASFAAQRRFVANAAHELRTPLTVERTILQVALADPDASAAAMRATCEELLAAGRDQERLLEALLTLAISQGGIDRREPVDLAQLARRSGDARRAETEQRELTLTTDLRPASTSGDPTLIERLIANLLDNAIGYNQPGGSVVMTTDINAARAVLTMSNTGSMIPAEEIERLFEPFQRMDAERIGADGHRGLGLSIVRAIATAHDATVTAEPQPDGGLLVSVSFLAA